MPNDMSRLYKDQETEALFSLVKTGLWGAKHEWLSSFPLPDDSWRKVLDMARQQTVVGIAYAGLCRLPDRLMPSEDRLVRWVAEIYSIEMRNRRMNKAVLELYTLFGRHGLTPVLLKGQGAGIWYEKPLWRTCGDIDFYFPTPEERRQATDIIRQHGISTRREADGSICYLWQGIVVEHHQRLLDIANPLMQGHLRRIEHKMGYRKALLPTESKVEITIPSPTLNLLLLSTHIMKHAMGWGIGLRQLCDMACACRHLHKDVDANSMKKLCRRIGIHRWNRLLHSFLTELMGLAPSYLPYPDKGLSPQPLLDIVIEGGNFGFHSYERTTAMAQGASKRKIHTSCAFIRNMRFSCSYMPKEAFWTYMLLLTGQFK